MKFIDTHTHLYDEKFDQDRSAVIQRAISAGVERLLLPNCDRNTWDAMLQLADQYPEHCLPMAGLHPCYVQENYVSVLDELEAQLHATDRFCAVGEVGLDFYWDIRYKKEQLLAFDRQIGWGKSRQLPIVIHTREALSEGIACIEARQDGSLKGVFHCFSGSAEEAKKVIDLGFLLGIGGVLTFKNSSLAAVVKDIPLDYLLLETDAPYLAPHPYRGKRNESAYLPLVAQHLASIKEISIEEVAAKTTQNAKTLFNISN